MFDFDELDSTARGRAAAERFRRLPVAASWRQTAEESEEETAAEIISSAGESTSEDDEQKKGVAQRQAEDATEEPKERREKKQAEDPQRQAQLEAFERNLELELEALRCRGSSLQEGLLGALVRVALPDAGAGGGGREGPTAFFVDAMNLVLERTTALVRDSAGDKSSCLRAEECRRRTFAVGAVLAPLVLTHFREGAVRHFERLAALFLAPATGLLTLYRRWLGGPSTGKSPAEVKSGIDRAFAEVLASLRSLTQSSLQVQDLGLEEEEDPEEAEWRRDEERAWLEGVVRRPARLAAGSLGLPQVDPGNALLVLLRAPESGEEVEIPVSRRATAGELKSLLVDRLGHPASLELLVAGAAAGGAGARRAAAPPPLRPLKAAEPLKEFQGAPVVLGGVATLLLPDKLPGKDAPEAASEVLAGPPGDRLLSFRGFLLRTTETAMVQLLLGLRERFGQEPGLRAGVDELHGSERSDLVSKVQCEVLPTYGFEGSMAGVQAMRRESGVHSESNPVAAKIMKDIHQILDLRAPLPKLPVVKALEPPRFVAHQPARWLRHLNDEGFAVIAGCASEEEVARAYRLLWRFIEGSDAGGTVRKGDVGTWLDDATEAGGKGARGWPAGKDDGIIHKRGVGQSRALWFVRGLPGVRGTFASLWGTEQLVTSLDGAGVFRPYGHNKQWRTKRKSWFHVDQAHKKRGLHCVQGLLTLKDATPQSGGLVVVPRSHRFHADILKRYEWSDWNFIRLDADDPVLTEGSSGPRLVCARAGDLILWDSRTVHCNTAPLEEDEGFLRSQDLIRAVAYVCMTPAAWCTSSTFRERKRAVRRGITTAHWPHDFQIMSRHDEFPQPSLSGKQRELLCPKAAQSKLAREAGNGGGLREGCVSLFPPGKFTVTADSVPVQEVATAEWGRCLGRLQRGTVVEGHRLGMWLRLSSWPDAGMVPELGELGELQRDGEEAWVPFDGRELGLDPEPLLALGAG